MKNRKIIDIITATRFNKLSLNENAVSPICKFLKEKLQIKNAASIYQFVNMFNLSSLENSALSYIERLFTIVSDNDSFLDIEYNLISKIFASSELLVTSEIEVYKAVERWLNHKFEERSKHAEDLLLKVRLPLLSTNTIRHLLKDSTHLTKADGCVKILNKMLDHRVDCFYKSSSNYHTSRYCSQKYLKLLICGGFDSEKSTTCSSVSCIDVYKAGDVEIYPPMTTERYSLKVVHVKGDIFVFGGFDNNNDWIMSVDKYSLTSRKWSQVGEMHDKRNFFCACAFMNKVIVVGGYTKGNSTNSCLQFDTRNYIWKEVSSMDVARATRACAVFEERIVVCGGCDNPRLNTVESYDVLPDKWSPMPSLNFSKNVSSLVVVKHKLFVISKRKDSCEVYDNVCKRFIAIKSPRFNLFSGIRANAIENKIFAFQDDLSKIITYDSQKNEWSEELCGVTKNLNFFTSVNVPSLYEH